MSSNEEYLDNLLKSMGDEAPDISDDVEDFSADIDAMFAELGKSGSLTDMYAEENEESSAELPKQEESDADDMSELLNALQMPETEDMIDVSDASETKELINDSEEIGIAEPSIEESAEEALSVEELTTEELSIEEPAAEELSIDETALEEFFVEEPAAEEASVEESAAEEASVEEPVIEEPTIEEIPVNEPVQVTDSAPTVESTQELTQEEIENMLAAFEDLNVSEAEADESISDEDISLDNISMEGILDQSDASGDVSEEAPAMDKEEEDILALLDSIQDDDGVNEINDLLSKADNNEAVDESIFKEEDGVAAAAEIAALLGDETESTLNDEENAEKNNKKEKKVKKEKVKKEKVKKEQSGEEKASKEPGFFGKLFSKLTEEEEVEPISEENQNIMDELNAEDAAEAGKKKKMKKGLMPGKKGKEEDSGQKDKKGNKKGAKKEKPKKESKPKKEKPVKAPAVPEKPGKRISKKSIIVILLFAGTIFGIIFFASSYLSGMLQKQRAKDAFANKDYMSCYEELYGLDLSEEEDRMFHHARTVLKVERRLNRYQKYVEDYQMVEALDTLMQALVDYDELYAEAQSYGAEAEVNAFYDRIYDILERDYGLTREAAHTIAFCDSKVDYTRYLTALAAGERISAGGSGEGLTLPETQMQDVLPEEEELLPPTFLD